MLNIRIQKTLKKVVVVLVKFKSLEKMSSVECIMKCKNFPLANPQGTTSFAPLTQIDYQFKSLYIFHYFYFVSCREIDTLLMKTGRKKLSNKLFFCCLLLIHLPKNFHSEFCDTVAN